MSFVKVISLVITCPSRCNTISQLVGLRDRLCNILLSVPSFYFARGLKRKADWLDGEQDEPSNKIAKIIIRKKRRHLPYYY